MISIEILTPKFLFERFQSYKNIDYEIEWILGYYDRNIFKEDFYKSIKFSEDYVYYDVSDSTIEILQNSLKEIKLDDIGDIINILYTMLYMVGGTN